MHNATNYNIFQVWEWYMTYEKSPTIEYIRFRLSAPSAGFPSMKTWTTTKYTTLLPILIFCLNEPNTHTWGRPAKIRNFSVTTTMQQNMFNFTTFLQCEEVSIHLMCLRKLFRYSTHCWYYGGIHTKTQNCLSSTRWAYTGNWIRWNSRYVIMWPLYI